MDNLPQDPYMLMSYINMQLRDNYSDLDDLCASLDVERSALEARLADAGFAYDAAHNRFG